MVAVMIIGSRKQGHRTGCCGFTSHEDMAMDQIAELYRQFGQQHLRCQYVDIDDPEFRYLPEISRQLSRKEIGLPVVILDEKMISEGGYVFHELEGYIKRALS